MFAAIVYARQKKIRTTMDVSNFPTFAVRNGHCNIGGRICPVDLHVAGYWTFAVYIRGRSEIGRKISSIFPLMSLTYARTTHTKNRS